MSVVFDRNIEATEFLLNIILDWDDMEVQRADEGADVYRARFNSSMIDTRMLKESQRFKELHESYVIFIT